MGTEDLQEFTCVSESSRIHACPLTVKGAGKTSFSDDLRIWEILQTEELEKALLNLKARRMFKSFPLGWPISTFSSLFLKLK